MPTSCRAPASTTGGFLAGRLAALGSAFAFGPAIEPLDQHLQDDYPGVRSAVAAGVDTITVVVDAVDAAAWPEGVAKDIPGCRAARFPFALLILLASTGGPAVSDGRTSGWSTAWTAPILCCDEGDVLAGFRAESLALVVASVAGLLAGAGRRTGTVREGR